MAKFKNLPGKIQNLGAKIFWIFGGLFALRGQGGPRPKILIYDIFVEGKPSYQMLFTRSKNIDPSRIYRIFKIVKYIQFEIKPRALLAIISKF